MLVSGKRRIGELLVQARILTEEQLSKGLEAQKVTGERLGSALVKLGFIKEDDLLRALETQVGISRVKLSQLAIDPEVTKLVPESFAKRHKVFPVELSGKRLKLAMADPLNVFALDDVRIFTGYEIQPVLVGEDEVTRAIAEYYGVKESVDKVIKDFDALSLVPDETEDVEVERLREIVDEAPVVRLVNMCISQAVRERATDIHVEPQESQVRIRFRIDGVLSDAMTSPRRMHAAIVSRLKIMANMDIAERRLPQDGRVALKVEGEEVDFRVSTLPTLFGEKVVVRILRKNTAMNRLELLGFSPGNLEALRAMISRPYGIMLVTGPTGSGKTTTLYAALSELNDSKKNIVTVEDPVEYQISGTNQVQTNVKAGLTFSTGLRAILRQDPDIVMVGEIRDQETAEIAVRFSLTGHLVLSTMHTNDAAGALTRLVEMGVEPYLVASSVMGVVAQRLIRKICDGCRESYAAPPEAVRRLRRMVTRTLVTGRGWDGPEGLYRDFDGGEVKLYRGRGCPQCGGTGYLGRTALHEVMPVSQVIRGLVMSGSPSETIAEAAVGSGMTRLSDDGAARVLQGVTTLEEILRVTSYE